MSRKGRYPCKGWRATLATLFCLLAAPVAWADGFFQSTTLAGLEVSENSQTVANLSWGSALLSDLTQVPLRDHYSDGQQDLHVTMFTSLTEHFGVLWGFGTGEAGDQYTIDPSLHLGFIRQWQFGDSRSLAFRMSGVVGGYLTEKPCTADYGAIGGVQQVNCRMASSVMRPVDTLDYLLDEPPQNQVEASLTYKIRF